MQAGWWFGCHFLFPHINWVALIIPIDEVIFLGWPNHQPARIQNPEMVFDSKDSKGEVIPDESLTTGLCSGNSMIGCLFCQQKSSHRLQERKLNKFRSTNMLIIRNMNKPNIS